MMSGIQGHRDLPGAVVLLGTSKLLRMLPCTMQGSIGVVIPDRTRDLTDRRNPRGADTVGIKASRVAQAPEMACNKQSKE